MNGSMIVKSRCCGDSANAFQSLVGLPEIERTYYISVLGLYGLIALSGVRALIAPKHLRNFSGKW